jgi:hypothetical protein
VAVILAHTFDTFWLTLVRTDGLMLAFWLWAAVILLPKALRRGAETLSWRRALGGSALLVLATHTKPTVVVMGAPLILGWLLVDWRSAARLGLATATLGGLVFVTLQIVTDGGFWRSLALQGSMPFDVHQAVRLIGHSLRVWWGALALSAIGLWIAVRRRDGSWRDGAWLLCAAGPLSMPLLSKFGAGPNYLLPWACGQAVLAGRLFGTSPSPLASWGQMMGGLASAAIVCKLMLTQHFPLPTEQDRRTSDAFYEFVKSVKPPIMAATPDYASVLVGQSVLVESATFPTLAASMAPGTQELLRSLRQPGYNLLIEYTNNWKLVSRGYTRIAACSLGYFYGKALATLFVPDADVGHVRFPMLQGARCTARIADTLR